MLRYTLVPTALLTILAFSLPVSDAMAGDLTLESLSGPYGVSATMGVDSLYAPEPGSGQVLSYTGLLTFDGAGRVQGTRSLWRTVLLPLEAGRPF